MPAIGSAWDSFCSAALTVLGRGGTLTYSSRSAVMPGIGFAWDSFCSAASTVLGRGGTATYPSRSAVMPGIGSAGTADGESAPRCATRFAGRVAERIVKEQLTELGRYALKPTPEGSEPLAPGAGRAGG